MYRPKVNCSNHRWSSKIHGALPSFMNQRKGSDNQHLLSVITKNANTYKKDFGAFTNARLLKNASGQFLDDIAADWGVNIVDENDDEFKRFQIRFQLLRHRLGPSGVKDAIAYLFNISPNSFSIVSAGLKSIKVINLPFDFDSGDKSDLKRTLIAHYIRGMLPPEFDLKEVDYQAYADIHIYIDNVTPAPPMFINARQHYGMMKENAVTFLNYHAESINMLNAVQDNRSDK